jgi:DNA polymerase-3 subunit delta'
MALALDDHPHARSVLGPALAADRPSHAYLFHGPGGAGKREFARLFAAELLAGGSADPSSARARAIAGSHPDLTWVSPSGAHEILVSDVDGAVVAAATRTPFESSRRVFVIESADLLGEGAANRMLKTLEEPADYVHIVLVSDHLADVLPTIASRCQLVRFDGPSESELTAELVRAGVPDAVAQALSRLSLGDAGVARELASPEGNALRRAAEEYVSAVLGGRAAEDAPWNGLLGSVRSRGDAVVAEFEAQATAELEMVPRKERSRVQREWDERIKRVRRRVETGALGLALTLVESWLLDLAALAWGAVGQLRNSDRLGPAAGLTGPAAGRDAPADALVRAVAEVESTRLNLPLNVNEELALEALAYRLEETLAR